MGRQTLAKNLQVKLIADDDAHIFNQSEESSSIRDYPILHTDKNIGDEDICFSTV